MNQSSFSTELQAMGDPIQSNYVPSDDTLDDDLFELLFDDLPSFPTFSSSISTSFSSMTQSIASSSSMDFPHAQPNQLIHLGNPSSYDSISTTSDENQSLEEDMFNGSNKISSKRQKTIAPQMSSDDDHNNSSNSTDNNASNNSAALIRLPKVLRRDIRRSYANIFASVMNSAEEHMTRAFFQKFVKPSFTLYYSVLGPDNLLQKEMLLNGRTSAFRFFMGKYIIVPDLFIRVVEAKLKTSSCWNGKSELVAATSSSGTMVYSLPEEQWLTQAVAPTGKNSLLVEVMSDGPSATAVDSLARGTAHARNSEVEKHERILLGKKRKSHSSSSVSKAVADEMADFDGEFNSLEISPILLPTPQFIQCNTTIKFILDENKMIERLEMLSTMANPMPATS